MYKIIIPSILSFVIVLLAIIAFIFFNDFNFAGKTRTEEWGHFGDFVGGILGTVLTFVTIIYLRDTYLHQKKEAAKTEIENRFLKLVELHRQNIAETQVDIKDTLTSLAAHQMPINYHVQDFKFYRGHEAFNVMINDFQCIYDIVSEVHEQHFKRLFNEDNPYIAIHECIAITHRLFYFGWYYSAGKCFSNEVFFKEKIADLMHSVQKEKVYLFSSDLLQEIGKSLREIKGYHNYLSHYIRHLYQSIKYLDSQDVLSDSEKYQYAKLLRAQLTSYEQAFLFYNSMSSFGDEWEFKYKHEQGFDKRLITKYNLIKNLPDSICKPIKIHEIYTFVEFEYLSKATLKHRAKRRKDFELIYDKFILGEL